MKKLMLAAGAVAMASAAFANAPVVYDYKASVKYLDLKEINLNETIGGVTVRRVVYQKVQKTASLKGYLVQDIQGATSPIVSPAFPLNAGQGSYAATVTKLAKDQGANRGFLVVINQGATPAAVRTPKILPAVLDAKWMNTKMSVQGGVYMTEGYLFVGGDRAAAAVRGKMDYINGQTYPTERTIANTPAVALMDYGWTSMYLFGGYNGPQYSARWVNVQNAIDAAQDVRTALAGARFYHDTWMNHSGFGKATVTTDPGFFCCGMTQADDVALRLDSLAGNLKGGLFICSENGYVASPYRWFANTVWEDQFLVPAVENGTTGYPIGFAGYRFVSVVDATPGVVAATVGADVDQADLWQDGDTELNTTDCIYGSWSIKLNTRLESRDVVKADLDNIFTKDGRVAAVTWYNDQTANKDRLDLLAMIKGAAWNLNRNMVFTGARENWEIPANANRYNNVPVITPAFADYYSLAEFQKDAGSHDVE